jgi:hypothetical protein
MSVWLVAAITAVAVGVAIGLMLIARRLVPTDGLFGSPEPNHTGSAHATLGAGFAILTAFVLLLAFQSYLNAKRNADTEARVTRELFVLAEFFNPRSGERLQGELVCYGRAVVFQEWPLMADQRSSPTVDDWALELETTIHDLRVSGPKDTVQYAEWFDQLVLQDEGRRERLQEAAPFVPTLLWIALIGGAVVLIGYVCLFANPRIPLGGQLAVVGAIAAVVSVNLCVIYFLDHPYEGVNGSVRPVAMEDSLAFMDAERQRLGLDTGVPCDERGALVDQSI